VDPSDEIAKAVVLNPSPPGNPAMGWNVAVAADDKDSPIVTKTEPPMTPWRINIRLIPNKQLFEGIVGGGRFGE
jgi:hypothetical protein